MNPNARLVAQTNSGCSVWSSAPCEHGVVTLGVISDEFPIPLALVQASAVEADSIALSLVLMASHGELSPN